MRQWLHSGEVIKGRERIGEVESHFAGLRLGVGRRHACGDTLVVEWSTDYGDGCVYRNVTVADLHDGEAIRATDYWGEAFRSARLAAVARGSARHAVGRALAGSGGPSGGRLSACSGDAREHPLDSQSPHPAGLGGVPLASLPSSPPR